MTLTPRILAALKKVDVAHAELFAALEDEARRKRPGGSGRRRSGPTGVQSIKRGAIPKPHPSSLP
jgi:hypothetical protein